MNRNVGQTDRIIRIILGVAILVAGYLNASWWGLLGLVPLFTATLGWCPLYLPFGLSTCSVKQQKT